MRRLKVKYDVDNILLDQVRDEIRLQHDIAIEIGTEIDQEIINDFINLIQGKIVNDIDFHISNYLFREDNPSLCSD